MAQASTTEIIITCEHASHDLPAHYKSLFTGKSALLKSHEGWDPGAFKLAQHCAEQLKTPLYYTRVSRLLVETNRSPKHPQLFSSITKGLSKTDKDLILRHYYHPHRDEIRAAIANRIQRGHRVI